MTLTRADLLVAVGHDGASAFRTWVCAISGRSARADTMRPMRSGLVDSGGERWRLRY